MFTNAEAVIFDFDGTLVDSLWVWDHLDTLYLKKRGIQIPNNFQKDLGGLSLTETAALYKNLFAIEDRVEKIVEEWVNLLYDIFLNKITFKKGAFELITHLHRSGLKLGLGTSNNRRIAEDYLKSRNVFECFSSLCTSCEVGKSKPNPDVFLKVCEDLNVQPENCLVFEDTLEGVMAGKNAGMKVIAIYDSYHDLNTTKIKEIADFYIRDYEELTFR